MASSSSLPRHNHVPPAEPVNCAPRSHVGLPDAAAAAHDHSLYDMSLSLSGSAESSIVPELGFSYSLTPGSPTQAGLRQFHGAVLTPPDAVPLGAGIGVGVGVGVGRDAGTHPMSSGAEARTSSPHTTEPAKDTTTSPLSAPTILPPGPPPPSSPHGAVPRYGFWLPKPAASSPAPAHVTMESATSPSSSSSVAMEDRRGSWQKQVRTDHLNQTGLRHVLPSSLRDILGEACDLTALQEHREEEWAAAKADEARRAQTVPGTVKSRLSYVWDASIRFFTNLVGQDRDEALVDPDGTSSIHRSTTRRRSESNPEAEAQAQSAATAPLRAKPEPFWKILDLYPEGESIWRCITCGTPVALIDELVSTAFNGRSSRAYLMNSVVNSCSGPHETRMLLSGQHVVADTYCVVCRERIGWTYIRAADPSQKYKECKYILELRHVRSDLGWI